MEIYKYKIWTGKIPGVASPRCEEPTLVRPPLSPPTRPPSLDCTPCEALFDNVMIMNACMDCYNGLVNVCCPARGESCCGLIEDPCQPMYEMTVEQQNKYCLGCGKNTSNMRNILGTAFSINRHGPNSVSDPKDLCKCCNRTGRNDQDSNLVIFLDQDYNDIGHYSMWDGTMDQQDTFSNFVVVGDPLDPMTASVLNTTDFNFFKFLKDIQYTIDWGDGLGNPTTLTAPITNTNYTYTTGPGTYTINIQMSAPWGVSSVSHTTTVPYQTGANILSSIVNTGQTYTFTPPGFTTPVSMDYETSDWGPLDSGLDINGYVTSFYNSAAITGYLIQGVTESMLSSLQSYNPLHQTAGLPPGYATLNPVSVAGQSQLPDGSFVDNLIGEIINFDPDPYVGWTAYTITNCGASPCQTFTMLDHVSGETVFETLSYGLNPEDYLLRECGYAIQGACDICNGVQVYYDGISYITQDVYNDRGVWDITEVYEPTDFVYLNGCCFFAVSSIIAGIEPDPTDTTSPFWRLCYGSCPLDDLLPPKYDCIGGVCILISPTSSYYPTAPFTGPTGADALTACLALPCVPTVGDPIHYNCVDGNCVPVSPSAFGWGGADYQGVGALSLCQAAQNAGTCVNTTTNYNCVSDGAGGTSCVSVPFGIYPDLISCQSNCGGVITFYDWYCINVPPDPSNGNTGHDCQAVPQGNAPPANAVTPLQIYTSDQDCINNGCGVTTYQWYCKCTIGIEETIVDLGTGQYGGHECTQLSNGPAGGFNDKTLCEDNCVSWECDGHGLCEGPHSVTNGPIGSYCSEFDMVNGGLKYWTDQTYIDVPGCDDDCDTPNAWACMGGNCTEVLENSTCINNNHVNNGTLYNGSCIDWAFANNMPSLGCSENDETQCNANLAQSCGGGCGECDSIETQMNMTEWPFRLYSSTDSYNAFDVVIGFAYSDSQNNSKHKYWYKPFPICDPTMGILNGPDGLPSTPDDIDCGDPNIIAICESSAYGSGTYHPCTDLSAPSCDTPPIINMSPPIGVGESRFSSQTCWEPCNE